MSDGFREMLLSPMWLLWAAGSVMAAFILLGAVNRRRSRLTDALRNYVDRAQADSKPPADDR